MKQTVNKLVNHLKNDQRLPLYLVPHVEMPKLLEIKHSLLSRVGKTLAKLWRNYFEANKSFVKAHALSEQNYWK